MSPARIAVTRREPSLKVRVVTKTGTWHRVVHEGDAAPLIVIVDDDEDTREVFGEFFQMSGLRVALACLSAGS